ncbi:hypothetical protein ABTL82_19745, partial [Acinetobacter baumannii]
GGFILRAIGIVSLMPAVAGMRSAATAHHEIEQDPDYQKPDQAAHIHVTSSCSCRAMKPLAARRPPPRLDVRDLYALPLARTQA